MMSPRRMSSIRAQLQSLVDRLDRDLPGDYTVDELFAVVERLRGRRIDRLPLPEVAPAGLCGMWLAYADHDVLFLRNMSDPHDALHELGHILLDHGQEAPLVGQLGGLLAQKDLVAGSAVRGFRGASSYDPPDEYSAELFATMMRTRVRTRGPRRDGILKAF
ncbi:hypothetical protein [Nocardia blacklockiae]|uniref:hypothetical protein n=1 Tax=Nocardia blacklockiae TaxID=480036 RepID=UPI001895BA2C|nr:hypothetical protein [Nocardia blacklockiae]MBF6171153.1 hypothetical protein [Nocardia blacklockiae]